MFRSWLLRKLGGVDVRQFDHLYSLFVEQNDLIVRSMEIRGMQAAWKEAQRERKANRYH